MSENELFEHRIKTLENDVKILYGKVNTFAINQAEENTKLDNLLLSVGELKESISEINADHRRFGISSYLRLSVPSELR